MRFPPFSKPLIHLIQHGKCPYGHLVIIYMGEGGWEKAYYSSLRNPTSTLLLPLDHSPADYSWPVDQCFVCIYYEYKNNCHLSDHEINHRIESKHHNSETYEEVIKDMVKDFSYILFKHGAQYVCYLDTKKHLSFHYDRKGL